jgi:hypothetical protein
VARRITAEARGAAKKLVRTEVGEVEPDYAPYLPTGKLMTRRSTTEVREAVQKLVHEAIDADLTDSDSHQSTKAADDDISPADELQLIGRDQRITDGFKTYIFCNDVNPMTRVPKFNNLKGRALYNAIQGLPRWEQCQELMQLFIPLDTLIYYLFDEESLKIPKRKTMAEKGQVAWVLMAHGYPRKMICKKKILHKKRTNMLTYMKVVLEMLRTAEPRISPPPGPTEINITIEGPFDMSYCDQPGHASGSDQCCEGRQAWQGRQSSQNQRLNVRKTNDRIVPR